MTHTSPRKRLGGLIGLAALTVALVISAGDQGVAVSRHIASQARQEGRSGGASQPRVHWWKDPAVIKEIGLRPEQADRIDLLWNNRSKAMAGSAAEHRKQQDELNRMMEERKVGPETIGLQVDRVEAHRTTLNKSWTVMIYEFSLVMTPEQNKALAAYRARTRRQGR